MPKKPVRKRAKSSKRKSKSKSPVGSFFKRILRWSFAGLFLLLLTYIGYLDYTVRHLFEGKRWSIPARVYANPVELYAGSTITLAQFETLLGQLRYRRDARLATEATYYRSGRTYKLRTRKFQFWDKQQPARSVQLKFSGAGISSIRDIQTSQNVPILRMDPAQIGSFYPALKEDRILVKLDQVPKPLVDGLIAVEDRIFYEHHGISLKGIVRAMLANIKAGKFVQGGSTITQQLVKNFYLSSERSLSRKINEAIMALILEARYSKEEILEAYMNEIYLGQDGARAIHGFGLASRFYFDRGLGELQLHHHALLIALVKGASHYDPRRNPKNAIKRRNLVIDAMLEQGYVSEKQARDAKLKKLEVSRRGRRSASKYPAFLDLVRRQLRKQYQDEDLTSEGLHIFTTLDLSIQQRLEETIKSTLKQLERRKNVNDLQTASVITRREGGEIVALVGGRDARFAGFNRALDIHRMIGSLVKPAVYLTALEKSENYTITSPVEDRSIQLKSGGKLWSPKNFDRKEHGDVPLHQALVKSYNLATVHLGMEVGISNTIKTLHNLGVDRELNRYPSLFLGAIELSPLEVTQMYQTLAGDGFRTPLRAIQSVIASDGTPLQRYPLTVRQSVDPAAVFILNTILQRAMSEGTGRSVYAALPKQLNVAGKTGTTNKLRDSWFAGFSGDFLGVVWVGRDDNRSTGLTGSSGALKIWANTMKDISKQPVDLIPPDTIEWAWVDNANGLRANDLCDDITEYPYIVGSAPIEKSPCMVRSNERTGDWFDAWF